MRGGLGTAALSARGGGGRGRVRGGAAVRGARALCAGLQPLRGRSAAARLEAAGRAGGGALRGRLRSRPLCQHWHPRRLVELYHLQLK